MTQLIASNSYKANILEIRFSPYDDIYKMIKRECDDAKKSIKVMTFLFTYKPIADVLINAKKRGVEVQVISDIRTVSYTLMSLENGEDINIAPAKYLIKNNIDFSVYKGEDSLTLMHHKVILIDEEKILMGSYNFYLQSQQSNHENFLLANSSALYQKYNEEFNLIWKSERTFQLKSIQEEKWPKCEHGKPNNEAITQSNSYNYFFNLVLKRRKLFSVLLLFLVSLTINIIFILHLY